MKTLGLTGGIGSGKTAVASLFEKNNIPVFNSDREAKKLYTESSTVKNAVLDLLGENAYENNLPNTSYIGKKVFSDKDLLHSLNKILHPELAKVFSKWKSNQKAQFVVNEAAILFESGANKRCDAVLMVTADKEVRIQRVMQRDSLTRELVEARINNQWKEEDKILLSDFVLYNNKDLEDLKQSFNTILSDIRLLLKE